MYTVGYTLSDNILIMESLLCYFIKVTFFF
jgi:hypothetical protein